MLKKTLVQALLAFTMAAASHARAAEFGTAAEARAMLDRAVIAVKTDQADAINQFNYNNAQFRDRDLFVFCFNRRDGKFTAHEAMVGWDVQSLQDIWGSPFGEEMFRVKDGQTIEVTYMSPLPGTIGLVPKRAYVTGVGDQSCGVSAYQLDEGIAQTR